MEFILQSDRKCQIGTFVNFNSAGRFIEIISSALDTETSVLITNIFSAFAIWSIFWSISAFAFFTNKCGSSSKKAVISNDDARYVRDRVDRDYAKNGGTVPKIKCLALLKIPEHIKRMLRSQYE